MNASKLAETLNLTRGTVARYWNGERLPPANLLFDIADAVDADAQWLVRGLRVSNRDFLAVIDDADWVQVPTYDLSQLDDGGKGEPVAITPMRRDWLNRELRTANGLWLTGMPSDYPAAGLLEGDRVFCKDIDLASLRERQLCLWRETATGRVLTGRFGIAWPESIHIDERDEYWINRQPLSDLGGPPSLLPIAQIVGRPIAQIR